MSKHVLIVDKITDLIEEHPDRIVVTAADYIANRCEQIDLRRTTRIKVINLCNKYDYLSQGYYCSLMAEARQQRCVPAALDIISLKWKRLYQSALPELNQMLEKAYRDNGGDEVAKTCLIYFGRIENPALQPLARRIFDIFRFPVIALELKYTQQKWVVQSIEAWQTDDIPREKTAFFNEALNMFTGAAWSARPGSKHEKYWLAILHDPDEKFAPSNRAALKKFVRAGRKLNVFVELITRNDLSSLLEYDMLLIRETTAIDHHTFRAAHKAESEGIPVIDDTASIIRCCNKAFLHELMHAKKIPAPRTLILDRKNTRPADIDIPFPVILKIPDGSFSRGVFKVETPDELAQALKTLFAKSDIILAQEFVPSEFDWRIGVLGGEPLFACKYYMVKDHWQIYNHKIPGKKGEGDSATVPVEDVPKEVMKTALRAAKLIGDGLYGVDLKQTKDGVFVIEVNDNPNIDAGYEDAVAGDELYRRIIAHMIALVEAD